MNENEQRLGDLWDIIKCANTCITEVPKEEGKGQKTYLKK